MIIKRKLRIEVELDLWIDKDINTDDEIKKIVNNEKVFMDICSLRGYSLKTTGKQKLIYIGGYNDSAGS